MSQLKGRVISKGERPHTPNSEDVRRNPYATPPITYHVPTPKGTRHVIPPDDEETLLEEVIFADKTNQPRYNLRSHAPVACAVTNEATGALEGYTRLLRGPDRDTWHNAYGNDICRLAQGMPGRPEGTNTIFFIPRSAVPRGSRVTYGKK